MKIKRNKRYDPEKKQPLCTFKYAMEFDRSSISIICSLPRRIPIKEVMEWCDENYGPQLPTDDDPGWNWALWSLPPEKNVIAIMYFHSKEDAVAFKLRWF